MQSGEIRKKFLDFFKNKGHKITPSSSLVPENDPSVLFTTAGMQQFKPFYLHPEDAPAKNVVSIQKCVRTSDIDEVGDDTHLTFFEMLGNFSFGGYWKKEAIEYAYEFITKELELTIDYVSVFKDDESGIPEDLESHEIWAKIDSNLTIKAHNKADNFWGPTGEEGPCGPTTEIYVNGVEIWNIVFNEYYRTKEGKYEPLKIKGIDTGMGLERLLVQVQKKNNVYETDLFNNEKSREERIVADHIKASAFMIADEVVPSNEGRGYILRRLLRRAIRFSDALGMLPQSFSKMVESISAKYKSHYDIIDNVIMREIDKEEKKFRETLEKGMKEFKKGIDPFILATTYGFPIELTEELAKEDGRVVDIEDFNQKMKEHQKLSQTASAGMFKGGLANHEPKTIKLHTAHHLLLAGLQKILGNSLHQKGSNINEERLRIDFNFERKMTEEEKKKVEDFVNEAIKVDYQVVRKEMKREEAEALGAEMEFGAKYPDIVSVYMIVDKDGNPISKEFCGGPHVSHTGELGHFKIQKEEASSQGVRRIKAVLN
jgi:alanyl-tRNA synthetase